MIDRFDTANPGKYPRQGVEKKAIFLSNSAEDMRRRMLGLVLEGGGGGQGMGRLSPFSEKSHLR